MRDTASEVSHSSVASIPFDFSGNLAYVTLTAGDSKPMTFILETGAGMTVIDENAAAKIGLEVVGMLPVAGAGDRNATVRLADASHLALGRIVIPKLPVGVASLDRLHPSAGRRFDGLLGYDVLGRYVVELDYVRRMVTFYDPDQFRYSGPGEVLPFTLECNALIHVVGRISQAGRAPIEERFVVDTGAGGPAALILSSPFVRNHDLPGPGRETLGFHSKGHGLAGTSSADIGRVDEFRLGRVALKRPITFFSHDREGFLSWPGRGGVIGNEILRRFKTTINYRKRQIILEKNGSFTDPFECDMSGMTLQAEGPRLNVFRIVQVSPDSPAEESGLKEGDVISGVDGHPSDQMSLAGLRSLFLKDGQVYSLAINRGGQVRLVQLRTRRAI